MYIQQADLFKGMNKEFIKKIMDNMEKKEYEKNYLLFRKGDPANYFYVLLKGHIRLCPIEDKSPAYLVSKPGEAFGWSSLVDRKLYTSSARCIKATKVIRIQSEAIDAIIEKDPESGVVFYKRIADLIGRRLIYAYGTMHSANKGDTATSYGTGQIMDSAMAA